MWLATPIQWLSRWLFGADIFVAYERIDGSRYASALTSALKSAGLDCINDRLETIPGEVNPESLDRKLRQSAVLVVVGTQGSYTSASVAYEIRTYLGLSEGELKRGTKNPAPKRFIIPIDLHGSIESASWWALVKGAAHESEELSETKPIVSSPSPLVVARVRDLYTYKTGEERRKITNAISAAVLLVVSIVSGVAISASLSAEERSRVARANAKQARISQLAADGKRINAEEIATTASSRAGKADRDAFIAQGLMRKAEGKKAAAERDQKAAQAQAKLARAAEAISRRSSRAMQLAGASQANWLLDSTLALSKARQSYSVSPNPFAATVMIKAFNSNELFYRDKFPEFRVDLSPDGKLAAYVGEEMGQCGILDLSSGKSWRLWPESVAKQITDLTFVENGQYVFARADRSKSFFVFASDGHLVSKLEHQLKQAEVEIVGETGLCAFKKGNGFIATDSFHIYRWTRRRGFSRLPSPADWVDRHISLLRATPDGSTVIEARLASSGLRIWRPNRKVPETLTVGDPDDTDFPTADISPNGDWIIAAPRSADGARVFYRGQYKYSLKGTPEGIDAINCSPDGKKWLVNSPTTCAVYRLENNNLMRDAVLEDERSIIDVEWNPQSSDVAIARRDGMVTLYDVQGHQAGVAHLGSLDGANGQINRLGFLRTEAYFAPK